MAQRELPPHGPRRAGLPQRVLQALLPDLAQECALASADILSMSVHIRIQVLSPGYVSFRQMRALVSPFPPVGSMAALSEPCGSPPSSVLWGRKTAPPSFLAPFVDPRGHRYPPLLHCERRWRALLGSWAIPVETCLGLETPAIPVRPRYIGPYQMLPSASLTASASQPD
jgi:hypothetical protein